MKEGSKAHKVSVLIAYNDENVSSLLDTTIKLKFCSKIDIARNRADFFTLTSASDYDIIFMGITFSKNIFLLIRKFKEQSNVKTPLVLFTSYMTEEMYNNSIENDIYDFLVKPFSLIQIYSLINRVLFEKGHEGELCDTRRYVRTNKKLSVRYSILNRSQADKNKSKIITIKNLCNGGLCFSDNYDFSKNDILKLEISLDDPYNKNVISTSGIVRWVKKTNTDKKTVGIEFRDLNSSDRLRISHSMCTP